MHQKGFTLAVRRLGPLVMVALAMAALASLMIACASALPPTSSPSQASPTQAPVTVMVWHTQTGSARAQLETFMTGFSKGYPWITVRGESKRDEGDLLRQGIAAVALNQPPDLVIASPRTIAEFARREALVGLDPLMRDPEIGLGEDERNDLIPGALDRGCCPVHKEQRVAFPFDARAVVLYYNADLLRAAKYNAPPAKWEDWSIAARTTTRDNVYGWVMSPDAAVFAAFVYSRGGSLLNETETQVLFDGDATLRSLQLIAALTKGGAAYLAESPDQARTDFAAGKAAFWFGTTGDLESLSTTIAKARKFQWGLTTIPQADPSHPATTLLGANTAIFRTAEPRQRAAWLFARWLAAPPQTAAWSGATLALPVRLAARPLLAGTPPAGVLPTPLAGLGDPPATGRGMPTVKNADGIDLAIVEMWASVANGTDPAAAIQRAVSRANRLLGQTP